MSRTRSARSSADSRVVAGPNCVGAELDCDLGGGVFGTLGLRWTGAGSVRTLAVALGITEIVPVAGLGNTVIVPVDRLGGKEVAPMDRRRGGGPT